MVAQVEVVAAVGIAPRSQRPAAVVADGGDCGAVGTMMEEAAGPEKNVWDPQAGVSEGSDLQSQESYWHLIHALGSRQYGGYGDLVGNGGGHASSSP